MAHDKYARLQFVLSKSFIGSETEGQLVTRLSSFVYKLRAQKWGACTTTGEADARSSALTERLDDQAWRRIKRRAARLVAARKVADGLASLKEGERDRIMALLPDIRIARISSEHRADEIADELHGRFPWMAPATEQLWYDMRTCVREGQPGFRARPLLLDGPPGIGKSAWARSLSSLVGVPDTVFEASNENASFGLVGSQRAWGNSTPGRLIEDILRNQVANPVVVVDEVEKAGIARTTAGNAFDLAASLLPLLERMTAERWTCPYYEVQFNMAFVTWVLTTNNAQLLPEPLRSHSPPIRLRNLHVEEGVKFAEREGRMRGLSDTSIDALSEALMVSFKSTEAPSLRTIFRMIDLASNLQSKPILQ